MMTRRIFLSILPRDRNGTKYEAIINLFALALLLCSFSQAYAIEEKVRIFAASSLGNVLSEVSKVYGNNSILLNFDATSKLAKQIEAGAPADIFFSADSDWMDYLNSKGKIHTATRVDLLSNRLVLIVPSDANKSLLSPRDLLQNDYHHIALAAESVPAGKFARSALRYHGVHSEQFAKKVVNADNVRVALKWVVSREASAGVVYATDALTVPEVKVAFVFDKRSHPKIIYPMAIIKSTPRLEKAKKFLDFCQSPRGKEIFRKAGFIIL